MKRTSFALLLLCLFGSVQPLIPRPAVLNVKTGFGAAGNGVADDTDEVQAALNACGPGDSVYFPPGTYRGNWTLSNSCKEIFGERDQSILLGISNGPASFSVVFVPNSTDHYIHDLVVSCNGGTNHHGFKFENAPTGLRFQFNRLKGFCSGNNLSAIFLPSGLGIGANYTLIDHNIFEEQSNLFGHGIFATGNPLNKARVNHNYFKDVYQPIFVGCEALPEGDDVTIDNNTILNAERNHIELCQHHRNLSISGNYITTRLSQLPNCPIDPGTGDYFKDGEGEYICCKDPSTIGECPNLGGGWNGYGNSSMAISAAVAGVNITINNNKAAPD